MRRVHRNLAKEELEALRLELTDSIPEERKSIPSLLRTMRLITRKSQAEYARLCGVAPRVLTDIEAGTGRPTVETLEKLLKPFGYRVGIVQTPVDEDAARPGPQTRAATKDAAARSRTERRAHDTVQDAIEKVRARRKPQSR